MKDLLKIKNLIKNHIVDHNQLAECGSCRCIYKIDSFKDYIIKVPINKEGEKEINFEINNNKFIDLMPKFIIIDLKINNKIIKCLLQEKITPINSKLINKKELKDHIYKLFPHITTKEFLYLLAAQWGVNLNNELKIYDFQ